MAYLGEMHRLGRGISVDYKAAHSWFERAAQRKSSIGINGLGILYLNGYGVDIDYAKAYSVSHLMNGSY